MEKYRNISTGAEGGAAAEEGGGVTKFRKKFES
jgi:hypothetical protein